MGTTDKALSLLALFSSDEPQWTVDAAAGRLGVPTSTAYRYFRSLADAGLIVAFSAGRYVIGPGIFELDRMARRTDPLIVAANRAMDALFARDPEKSVVLLARIYRRRVMCVDQRPHGHEAMALSYERGRPMPFYRGSVSKIILANLPARTMTRYFAEDHQQIAEAGLGADLQRFRGTLRAIRKAGFCVSRGEVDKGVIGIAAPIFAPEGEAFASIGVVIPQDHEADTDFEGLIGAVVAAAKETSDSLKN